MSSLPKVPLRSPGGHQRHPPKGIDRFRCLTRSAKRFSDPPFGSLSIAQTSYIRPTLEA
jgi:hypothetical protein